MERDLIIIGGGIAGLTCAIYGARGGLKTAIIESKQLGGQIIEASNVENYPGYVSIRGKELIENVKKQVTNLGVEIIYEEVKCIEEGIVITENKTYDTKTIVIATGLYQRTLDIASNYIGKGVSYCATCDGAFFKGKDVAIIGGGNTALEDAIYLSKIVNKVYLIIRSDKFKGEEYLISKVKDIKNVEIIYKANVIGLNGGNLLTSIKLDNGKVIDVNGLFLAIGSRPNTEFLKGFLELDKDGFIISNDGNTKYKSVFVAGDVRKNQVRQLVVAAADGVLASKKCLDYINSRN